MQHGWEGVVRLSVIHLIRRPSICKSQGLCLKIISECSMQHAIISFAEALALLTMRHTSSREALERMTGWEEKLTAGTPVERRMSYTHQSDSCQKDTRSSSVPVPLLPEMTLADNLYHTVARSCGDCLSPAASKRRCLGSKRV